MKPYIGILMALLVSESAATQIPFKDLTNLLTETDHVLVGTVTHVDMLDGGGHPVSDVSARTGPGSENLLRLHVAIQSNGVIASSSDNRPAAITIPLWQKWHDTLGNRKREVEAKTYIFLLQGPEYTPVYHGLFMRELSERPDIERILKEMKTQNNGVVLTGDPLRGPPAAHP